MTMELSERTRKVLEAIVRGYLETGAPVGSRTISLHDGLDVSPATIRNDMADLADMGLIRKTHISSGRAPTEEGVRYYVDRILTVEDLSPRMKSMVQSMIPRDADDAREIIRAGGKALATLSNYTGVVWSPGVETMPLRHIEFVRLTEKRVMAVLVSPAGFFHTSVFDFPEQLTTEELANAADRLNERFGGKTLAEIRERIIDQMKEEKDEYDRLLSRALSLMESAIGPDVTEEELYIEGKANLVESPDLADVDKMKTIFKTFEEKGFLVRLINRAIESRDVNFYIASDEEKTLLPGLAMILAGYGEESEIRGTLGVMGPLRMDYKRVIPLVKYMARYMGKLLS